MQIIQACSNQCGTTAAAGLLAATALRRCYAGASAAGSLPPLAIEKLHVQTIAKLSTVNSTPSLALIRCVWAFGERLWRACKQTVPGPLLCALDATADGTPQPPRVGDVFPLPGAGHTTELARLCLGVFSVSIGAALAGAGCRPFSENGKGALGEGAALEDLVVRSAATWLAALVRLLRANSAGGVAGAGHVKAAVTSADAGSTGTSQAAGALAGACSFQHVIYSQILRTANAATLYRALALRVLALEWLCATSACQVAGPPSDDSPPATDSTRAIQQPTDGAQASRATVPALVATTPESLLLLVLDSSRRAVAECLTGAAAQQVPSSNCRKSAISHCAASCAVPVADLYGTIRRAFPQPSAASPQSTSYSSVWRDRTVRTAFVEWLRWQAQLLRRAGDSRAAAGVGRSLLSFLQRVLPTTCNDERCAANVAAAEAALTANVHAAAAVDLLHCRRAEMHAMHKAATTGATDSTRPAAVEIEVAADLNAAADHLRAAVRCVQQSLAHKSERPFGTTGSTTAIDTGCCPRCARNLDSTFQSKCLRDTVLAVGASGAFSSLEAWMASPLAAVVVASASPPPGTMIAGSSATLCDWPLLLEQLLSLLARASTDAAESLCIAAADLRAQCGDETTALPLLRIAGERYADAAQANAGAAAARLLRLHLAPSVAAASRGLPWSSIAADCAIRLIEVGLTVLHATDDEAIAEAQDGRLNLISNCSEGAVSNVPQYLDRTHDSGSNSSSTPLPQEAVNTQRLLLGDDIGHHLQKVVSYARDAVMSAVAACNAVREAAASCSNSDLQYAAALAAHAALSLLHNCAVPYATTAMRSAADAALPQLDAHTSDACELALLLSSAACDGWERWLCNQPQRLSGESEDSLELAEERARMPARYALLVSLSRRRLEYVMQREQLRAQPPVVKRRTVATVVTDKSASDERIDEAARVWGSALRRALDCALQAKPMILEHRHEGTTMRTVAEGESGVASVLSLVHRSGLVRLVVISSAAAVAGADAVCTAVAGAIRRDCRSDELLRPLVECAYIASRVFRAICSATAATMLDPPSTLQQLAAGPGALGAMLAATTAPVPLSPHIRNVAAVAASAVSFIQSVSGRIVESVTATGAPVSAIGCTISSAAISVCDTKQRHEARLRAAMSIMITMHASDAMSAIASSASACISRLHASERRIDHAVTSSIDSSSSSSYSAVSATSSNTSLASADAKALSDAHNSGLHSSGAGDIAASEPLLGAVVSVVGDCANSRARGCVACAACRSLAMSLSTSDAELMSTEDGGIHGAERFVVAAAWFALAVATAQARRRGCACTQPTLFADSDAAAAKLATAYSFLASHPPIHVIVQRGATLLRPQEREGAANDCLNIAALATATELHGRQAAAVALLKLEGRNALAAAVSEEQPCSTPPIEHETTMAQNRIVEATHLYAAAREAANPTAPFALSRVGELAALSAASWTSAWRSAEGIVADASVQGHCVPVHRELAAIRDAWNAAAGLVMTLRLAADSWSARGEAGRSAHSIRRALATLRRTGVIEVPECEPDGKIVAPAGQSPWYSPCVVSVLSDLAIADALAGHRNEAAISVSALTTMASTLVASVRALPDDAIAETPTWCGEARAEAECATLIGAAVGALVAVELDEASPPSPTVAPAGSGRRGAVAVAFQRSTVGDPLAAQCTALDSGIAIVKARLPRLHPGAAVATRSAIDAAVQLASYARARLHVVGAVSAHTCTADGGLITTRRHDWAAAAALIRNNITPFAALSQHVIEAHVWLGGALLRFRRWADAATEMAAYVRMSLLSPLDMRPHVLRRALRGLALAIHQLHDEIHAPTSPPSQRDSPSHVLREILSAFLCNIPTTDASDSDNSIDAYDLSAWLVFESAALATRFRVAHALMGVPAAASTGVVLPCNTAAVTPFDPLHSLHTCRGLALWRNQAGISGCSTDANTDHGLPAMTALLVEQFTRTLLVARAEGLSHATIGKAVAAAMASSPATAPSIKGGPRDVVRGASLALLLVPVPLCRDGGADDDCSRPISRSWVGNDAYAGALCELQTILFAADESLSPTKSRAALTEAAAAASSSGVFARLQFDAVDDTEMPESEGGDHGKVDAANGAPMTTSPHRIAEGRGVGGRGRRAASSGPVHGAATAAHAETSTSDSPSMIGGPPKAVGRRAASVAVPRTGRGSHSATAATVSAVAPLPTTGGAALSAAERDAWWATRHALDERMQRLCGDIERQWLRCGAVALLSGRVVIHAADAANTSRPSGCTTTSGHCSDKKQYSTSFDLDHAVAADACVGSAFAALYDCGVLRDIIEPHPARLSPLAIRVVLALQCIASAGAAGTLSSDAASVLLHAVLAQKSSRSAPPQVLDASTAAQHVDTIAQALICNVSAAIDAAVSFVVDGSNVAESASVSSTGAGTNVPVSPTALQRHTVASAEVAPTVPRNAGNAQQAVELLAAMPALIEAARSASVAVNNHRQPRHDGGGDTSLPRAAPSAPARPSPLPSTLSSHSTTAELRAALSAVGIHTSGMRKAELVAALAKWQSDTANVAASADDVDVAPSVRRREGVLAAETLAVPEVKSSRQRAVLVEATDHVSRKGSGMRCTGVSAADVVDTSIDMAPRVGDMAATVPRLQVFQRTQHAAALPHRSPVVLVISDADVAAIPWESLPAMRDGSSNASDYDAAGHVSGGVLASTARKIETLRSTSTSQRRILPAQPATRLPTHAFALWHFGRGDGPPAAVPSVRRETGGADSTILRAGGYRYLVNPGGDLQATQAAVAPAVTWLGAEAATNGGAGAPLGAVGAPPPGGAPELIDWLRGGCVYIYAGHGAGEAFLPRSAVYRAVREGRAADRFNGMCTALLMGCSSGRLAPAPGVGGEPDGAALALLTAGAPAVMGNLWDVTDRDCDRFTLALLDAWLGTNVSAVQQEHALLPAAAHIARRSVRLPYLIGAATITHGIPIRSAAARSRSD